MSFLIPSFNDIYCLQELLNRLELESERKRISGLAKHHNLNGFGQSLTLIKNTNIGAGPVAQWLSSCAPLQAAQCFVSSNPGRGHGTAHQTTLRQRPTCHKLEGPTTNNIQLCTGGLWGENGKKNLKKMLKNNFMHKNRKAMLDLCVLCISIFNT